MHRIWKYRKYLFLFLILPLLIRFIISHKVEFKETIALLDYETILLVLPLRIIILGLIGMQFFYVARYYGNDISVFKWLGIHMHARFLNCFAPQAGNAYKMAKLKMEHGFSMDSFLASLTVFSYINSFVTGILSFITILLLDRSLRIFGIPAYLLAFLVVLGFALLPVFLRWFHGVCIIFLPKKLAEKLEVLNNFVYKLFSGLFDKTVFIKVLIVGFLAYILAVIEMRILFNSLGVDMSFARISVLRFAKNLTDILSITPGNLGVTEVLYASLANLMQEKASTGLIVGVLLNLLTILATFVFSLFFSLYDIFKIRNKSEV